MWSKTNNSRLQNSKRNVVSGLIKQLVIIILSFIIRTVIIYVLGADYQGVSGLFTAILQVLNLTEMGFSAAVTFVLYKPIAEDDIESICCILSFLKKAYKIIGGIILIAGLAIMPFLDFLSKDDYPSEINIYVLYIIYLANAVISYWLFAYKNTLLTAMQRVDLVSNAYTITNIFGRIIQIVVIVTLKNIYIYVFMVFVTSVANNILVEYISRKVYPDIQARGIISHESKGILIKQVKAVFLNKIGDVARNSFDNIVISSFIGFTAVTAYGNYYYIYAAIYGFMGIIVHSVRAGIGNSLLKESVEKNYRDLNVFTFGFMWIVGWCTVCMLVLYQPTMMIWMKGDKELILYFGDMVLFCIYFYVICMAYTKNAYLEAKGLFYESRYLYIIEAVGNLLLNVILGKFFGITGVLVATIVTIVLFNFAGGTIVLFKYYFKKGIICFFGHHLFYFAVTIIAGIFTYFISTMFNGNGLLGLIVKIPICIFVPNLVFLLCYFRLSEFGSVRGILRLMMRKE